MRLLLREEELIRRSQAGALERSFELLVERYRTVLTRTVVADDTGPRVGSGTSCRRRLYPRCGRDLPSYRSIGSFNGLALLLNTGKLDDRQSTVPEA